MAITAPSTQDHLPIAGIQDGVVIMNDGSVRAVLKVEPINFELKSETEQNAIIYSYQAFLNSLDFPIQIIVQSKKLDLERYLMRLEEHQKNLVNELLKIQIEDYIGFVRRLISIANIMSKRFFVIISYSTALKKPVGGVVPHKPGSGPVLAQEEFERYQAEANNRAGIIASGLGRVGVKVAQLDTQQLIELFYGIYNPDIATEERLTDIGEMNAGVVTSEAMPGGPSAAPAPEAAPAVPAPNGFQPMNLPSNPLPTGPLVAPVAPVQPAPLPEGPGPVPPIQPTQPMQAQADQFSVPSVPETASSPQQPLQ